MPLLPDSHAVDKSHGDEVLEKIVSLLRGLQFGSVQVVVQDGMVVQIERIEKHRLRNSQRPRNVVGR